MDNCNDKNRVRKTRTTFNTTLAETQILTDATSFYVDGQSEK